MRLTIPDIRFVGFAALVLGALPCAALAQTPSTDPSSNTPFSSMAIARDEGDACRVPKPPADLAETAYLRNGYRAILRILIAEEALASQSCTCLLDQFTCGSGEKVAQLRVKGGRFAGRRRRSDVQQITQFLVYSRRVGIAKGV